MSVDQNGTENLLQDGLVTGGEAMPFGEDSEPSESAENRAVLLLDFDTSPDEVQSVRYEKRRIWELDALRGFAVFMMVFDHFMYLLWGMFSSVWFTRAEMRFGASVRTMPTGEFLRALSSGELTGQSEGLLNLCWFAKWYWTCEPRNILHPLFLFIFFSICGISCTFSKSNLKRGGLLLAVACLVSVVTYLFDEEIFIHFGTLTFLSFCILLYALIDFLSSLAGKSARKWICSAVCAICFVAVTVVYHEFRLQDYIDVPSAFGWLFQQNYLQGQFISPGEFTPFIPWSAFFFFGAAVGPWLYGKRKTLLPFLDRGWHKPICFVGRHALLVYVVHQIILVAVLALISYLFITPGSFGVI